MLGAISDKIPFTLTALITAIDDASAEATLNFSGEFNAMMAMLIKGPITQFLETLSTKMGEI